MRVVNHVSEGGLGEQIQRRQDGGVNRNRRAGICLRLSLLYAQQYSREKWRNEGVMGGAQEAA